jgi:hypothetical protein
VTPTTLTLNGTAVLTHSRTLAFGKCRRLHHLRYNLGIRPATDAKPLRIGSAVHTALDLLAKGEKLETATLAIRLGYSHLPDWCETEDEVNEWTCEAEMAVAMIRAYHDHYAAVIVPPEVTPAEIIHSEIDFDLPIHNPETGATIRVFRNRGKIDKIVRLADGRVAIMEHKTTSDDISPGSDYWLRLCIDQQVSRYMAAAQDLGHEPQTVLYDVIGKPKQSPSLIPLVDEDGVKIVHDAAGQRVRTKDGKKWRETADTAQGYVLQTRRETAEEYGRRVYEAMMAEPNRYFARREVPRLTSDLEAFRLELYQQAKDIHEANQSGRHFRNTASCIGYSRCEYLDVCARNVEPTRENPPSGFVAVADLHPELGAAQ